MSFLPEPSLGVFEPSFAMFFSLEAMIGVLGGSFLLGEGEGVFEFLFPYDCFGVFGASLSVFFTSSFLV